MAGTLIVEPDPGGHRFQAVANVARLAARDGEVVLLTSRGATGRPEFENFLADRALEVDERFPVIHPPTAELLAAIAEHARSRDVARVVVMDADQSLKRWWYLAPRVLRGVRPRPRVVFMLTRYPARLRLADRVGWKLRVTKASLALAAMATGSLHRVAGFAGREDLASGWLVKRARDPAICGAHSRDRAALRAQLGLPLDRRLVGIFGVIGDRKNVPFVLDALIAAGNDTDLLLAGAVREGTPAWLDGLAPERRRRVLVCDGFLADDELDRYVASSDAVAIALTNNGPSGIMGKALAAGVPVVTAGSVVRARELDVTRAGVATEFTVPAFAAAVRRVLDDPAPVGASTVPPATAEAFAAALLGTPGVAVLDGARD
jgi:glycosyltransferase involved in cell wall biosynthesis